MKIRIPSELSEIRLEQIQRIRLINENPELSDFAKKVHSVSIMADRTPTEMAMVRIEDLDDVFGNVMSLFDGQQNEPLQRIVKYLNREYAFIEDVRDMETGAFVDADQMTKDDGYYENLHKIMAILYRPIEAKIGKGYRLKSYVKESERERKERQAVFLKHMTYDVVRGATGFFLRGVQRSLGIFDNSFPVVPKLMEGQQIHGAGTISFTPYQGEAS